MKSDELIKYYERAIDFESTVRGVPMSEENLELCRNFVSDIHECSRKDVSVMSVSYTHLTLPTICGV